MSETPKPQTLFGFPIRIMDDLPPDAFGIVRLEMPTVDEATARMIEHRRYEIEEMVRTVNPRLNARLSRESR